MTFLAGMMGILKISLSSRILVRLLTAREVIENFQCSGILAGHPVI
jgi:hypothetical protein